MHNNVIFVSDMASQISKAIGECRADRLFILTDSTTEQVCLPVVRDFDCLHDAKSISIPAGDTNKSLEAVSHVWKELQRLGATRHSLLVNLGGGMVTDLGGFVASTFKRGISYINIPTTLLSMVDASVGGKTGFNFGGLKNEIGVFSEPHCVLIDTQFLKTLDRENILSGYAEMLKHGLISDVPTWAELIDIDHSPLTIEHSEERSQWSMVNVQCSMIERSVAVKQRIVTEDPKEQGLRKALNLGHTIGHAIESLAMSGTADGRLKPILHGYAVAYGLICELYLSVVKAGFPTQRMRQTVRFIHEHYGRLPITCDDYPALLQLMTHDKKNTANDINFTLLGDIGDIRINQTATRQEIEEALDFYREG
jgi:3-dehydroquinate synthase